MLSWQMQVNEAMGERWDSFYTNVVQVCLAAGLRSGVPVLAQSVLDISTSIGCTENLLRGLYKVPSARTDSRRQRA